MNDAVTDQMAALAESIKAELVGSKVELNGFPSGGAMLDVHTVDGHLFVMSYTPASGFGVDKVQRDDGFTTGYRFTFRDFAPAADQLRNLVSEPIHDCSSCQDVDLNLVVVYSRDVKAAKDFYRCLGMTFKQEKHGSGPEHYAAELGAVVFEIYPCRGTSPTGNTRLGFRLSSVDRVLDLLRQQKVNVLSEPRDSPWGRRAVVEDPDGNRVELTQTTESLP